MASATKKTQSIRKEKIKRIGQKRKGKLRAQGTTPSKTELFGDE